MQVFSAFGTVQKIAIFEKSAGFQALVQYPGTSRGASKFRDLRGHAGWHLSRSYVALGV
jgi:hypothetical protein